MWVWVKIKPPGIGPRVLVHVSTYQGNPFWVYPISDPQPDGFPLVYIARFLWPI